MSKRKKKTQPKPKPDSAVTARRELGVYYGDLPPKRRNK